MQQPNRHQRPGQVQLGVAQEGQGLEEGAVGVVETPMGVPLILGAGLVCSLSGPPGWLRCGPG